jgi:hypothetical protein
MSDVATLNILIIAYGTPITTKDHLEGRLIFHLDLVYADVIEDNLKRRLMQCVQRRTLLSTKKERQP